MGISIYLYVMGIIIIPTMVMGSNNEIPKQHNKIVSIVVK